MEKRSDILVEKSNVTNSFVIWKIMKDISLLNHKRRTLTDLARELNINRFHPYYNALMSYLIDREIVTIVEIIGAQKFIKINDNLLCREIEESLWG